MSLQLQNTFNVFIIPVGIFNIQSLMSHQQFNIWKTKPKMLIQTQIKFSSISGVCWCGWPRLVLEQVSDEESNTWNTYQPWICDISLTVWEWILTSVWPGAAAFSQFVISNLNLATILTIWCSLCQAASLHLASSYDKWQCCQYEVMKWNIQLEIKCV